MDQYAKGSLQLCSTAPSGVSPPMALDTGGTYLFLGWQPPEYSNGQLTGYFLFWEITEIYGGGQMQYNLTGLSVS